MMKSLTIVILLTIWGLLVVTTFWRADLRFLTPVEPPEDANQVDFATLSEKRFSAIKTNEGSISLKGTTTLLNFWKPDCKCTRFMERHVRELVKTYRPRGVNFVTVVIADAQDDSNTLIRKWRERGIDTPAVIDKMGNLAREFGVWASPSAVIFDRNGTVAYVGAYNIGRYCANKRTAYAQKALDALLEGKMPQQRQIPFYGCRVPINQKGSSTGGEMPLTVSKPISSK